MVWKDFLGRVLMEGDALIVNGISDTALHQGNVDRIVEKDGKSALIVKYDDTLPFDDHKITAYRSYKAEDYRNGKIPSIYLLERK